MSKAFTKSGTWQTLLTELTLAYSERRQAVGQSAYVPERRNVQQAAYWARLQNWLETYCTSFIDHDNGPLTATGDAFLYFTLDNWRAAAGIHQDGFMRKHGPKEALVTSYGQMEIGDAIGPWIFEDIQKGFGALKWLPFFKNIVGVRNLFPQVTGKATYTGNGSGPGFGVWYPLFGTLLGGSGTYNIILDNRGLAGIGGSYYISLGRSGSPWLMSGDGGGIILDTGQGSGFLSYSASLSFSDSVDLVKIYGCRLTAGSPSGYSKSFSASSVNVSAILDTAFEAPAIFEFFPVIKVPFTNA